MFKLQKCSFYRSEPPSTLAKYQGQQQSQEFACCTNIRKTLVRRNKSFGRITKHWVTKGHQKNGLSETDDGTMYKQSNPWVKLLWWTNKYNYQKRQSCPLFYLCLILLFSNLNFIVPLGITSFLSSQISSSTSFPCFFFSSPVFFFLLVSVFPTFFFSLSLSCSWYRHSADVA